MSIYLKKEDFEPLYYTLMESSKSIKNKIYSYLTFLTIIFISIINNSDLKYLLNKIGIFNYNIDISFDMFILIIPFLISLFHIFIIDGIKTHYARTNEFIKINTNLTFAQKKDIYLFPFVLNKSIFYNSNKNKIDLILTIFTFLLIFIPTSLLVYISIYSEYYLIINICALLVGILTAKLFYDIEQSNKTYIKIWTFIFTLFCSIIPVLGYLFLNTKIAEIKHTISGKKNKEINYLLRSKLYILKDITPLSKIEYREKFVNAHNQLDKDALVKLKTKYYNLFQGIEIEKRNIRNLFFYESDLINSKIKFTNIQDMELVNTNFIGNIVLDSYLKNFTLNNSNIIKNKFIDEYFFIKDSYTRTDLSMRETILSNWNIIGTNVIKNQFKNITFDNIKIDKNSNIKDNNFNKVTFTNFKLYSDIKLEDNNFTNVSFEKGIFYNYIFDINSSFVDSKFKNVEFIYRFNKVEKNIAFFQDKKRFLDSTLTIKYENKEETYNLNSILEDKLKLIFKEE